MIYNLSLILLATSVTCYAQCINQIQELDDCTCVGYLAKFECAHPVQNKGSTIWYFDDSSVCRIILFHSQFPDTGETPCSTRSVSAYSTSNEGDCFTSRLKVNVTASDNYKAVVCLYNDGLNEIIIDNKSLIITDTVNASYSVRVASIDSDRSICTFAWNHSDNCPDSYYLVNATSCDCPNKTTESTITCSNIETECTVSVQRIVCGGDVSGEFGKPTTCKMKPHKIKPFDKKYLWVILGIGIMMIILLLAGILIGVTIKHCLKRYEKDTNIELKHKNDPNNKLVTPIEEEGLPATVNPPDNVTRSAENTSTLSTSVVPFREQAESQPPTTWPRPARPLSATDSASVEFSANLIKEVLKQLKTFKSEMREDRHRTESELQSTKEGLKQLKKKVDSQDSAIQKKDDEIRAIKEELENTKGILSELERENILLKQNIEHMKTEYEQKVEQLQKTIEDLEKQKEQLQRETNEMIVSTMNENKKMLQILLTKKELQQVDAELKASVLDEVK